MKLKYIFIGALLLLSARFSQAQSDACATATFAPVIATCVNFNYSIPGSYSNSATPVAIPSCGTSANRDGWYRFFGNGNNITVNVTNTNQDMDVVVYSGVTCGLLTEVACQSTGNSATPANITIPTTAGTTYWVRIIRTNNGGSTMDGTICVVTAPLNDNCTGAQNLVQNTACTLTSSTVANATQSLPGCVGTANDDVWFSFTATSTNPTITVSNAGFDVVLELFDACSGNSLACQDTPEEINATGLTVGMTYFVRVYSFFNSSPANPTFDICVWDGTGNVNNCYGVSSTTFNFENSATHTNVVMSDDEFTPVIPLGFNFCFMGSQYTSLVISANGLISFDLSLANNFSDWETEPIPTLDPTAANSVMGPWHDIDPSVGGTIRYQSLGLAPNRRFVVTFLNVPNFDCTAQLNTQQIKLFEGSNDIEIHVQNRIVCTTWDDGHAVLGLNGPNGVVGIAAPGRNDLPWAATNEAWAFSCGASTTPCTPPLPVSLSRFETDCRDGRSLLIWNVGDEEEVDQFLVQAMNQGSAVTTLEQISPGQTQKEGSLFQWENTFGNDHWQFYRVASVDVNGEPSYSEWKLNVCQSAQPRIWSHKQQISIAFAQQADFPGTLEIYNVLGKRIASFTVNANDLQQSFDLAELSITEGVYICKLRLNRGVYSQKVLLSGN